MNIIKKLFNGNFIKKYWLIITLYTIAYSIFIMMIYTSPFYFIFPNMTNVLVFISLTSYYQSINGLYSQYRLYFFVDLLNRADLDIMKIMRKGNENVVGIINNQKLFSKKFSEVAKYTKNQNIINEKLINKYKENGGTDDAFNNIHLN